MDGQVATGCRGGGSQVLPGENMTTHPELFCERQAGNLTFFDAPDHIPGVRKMVLPDMLGQPPAQNVETSIAAADHIRDLPKTKRDQRALMEWLIEIGAHGATDDEIKQHFGWDGDYERPRRWTLCKHGMVIGSGKTRKTKDGFPAIVWVEMKVALKTLTDECIKNGTP